MAALNLYNFNAVRLLNPLRLKRILISATKTGLFTYFSFVHLFVCYLAVITGLLKILWE